MEKVNIQFHDNYTVTFQHKKILQFVPELSVDKNLKLTTPNIPLLVNGRAGSINEPLNDPLFVLPDINQSFEFARLSNITEHITNSIDVIVQAVQNAHCG